MPQFKVGSYRIDLVVIGGGKRLAIECDGERFHGPEKLQEDMERQAILERLGWQFVRVRGSVFFRDEDRAMQPIFRRLDELGITSGAKLSNSESSVQEDVLIQRVIRRAQELRELWQKEQPFTEKSHRDEDARSSRTRRGGNAFGQDDFHFV